MPRNTSVTLGGHYTRFIEDKVKSGRYESTSVAVRAGLRLLEEREAKLDILRSKLMVAEGQLNAGEGVDGETFMKSLMD